MVLTAAVLVLVALGAFVVGLVQESTALTWAAFGMSVLAGLVLAVGELRRRSAARAVGHRRPDPATGPASSRAPRGRGAAALPRADDDVPVRRVSPPPVPPSSPDVYGVGRRSHAEGIGDLARPDRPHPATGSSRRGAPTGSFRAGARDLTGGSAAPLAPRSGSSRAAPMAARPAADGEPQPEDVEMADLLLVLDLTDEVLVADRHARFHLDRCPPLLGQQTSRLPVDEARAHGLTPCSTCGPIRMLAAQERARRSM